MRSIYEKVVCTVCGWKGRRSRKTNWPACIRCGSSGDKIGFVSEVGFIPKKNLSQEELEIIAKDIAGKRLLLEDEIKTLLGKPVVIH